MTFFYSLLLRKIQRSISILLFFASALVLTNLATQGTALAASWSTPINISGADSPEGAQVAVSADGTKAIAVWNRRHYEVKARVATISDGGVSWGSVVDLSPTTNAAEYAKVAISSDGSKATAVWTRDGIIESKSATISDNTATWGDLSSLSNPTYWATCPEIALSANGTMSTAAWYSNESNIIVQTSSASISGNSANWGLVTNLSDDGQNADNVKVAVSSDGTMATAIWGRSDGTNFITQSRSATILGNAANWGSVTDLSESGHYSYTYRIALSSDGTMATALWSLDNGSNRIIQTKSATITNNAADWGSTTSLSAPGNDATYSNVALSSDGKTAIAIWERSNGTNTIIQSASASIATNLASWSSVQDLTSDYDSEISSVVLSSDGTKAFAIWDANISSDYISQSVIADLSEGSANWGSISNISASGVQSYSPAISLSSAGNAAVAVWLGNDGSDSYVQSSYNYVALPTPTPTATATPTPNPTSTATATPTSTASPSVTPTIAPTTIPDPRRAEITVLVDGKPVSGALVYFIGTGTCLTDSNGTCSISGLKTGKAYQAVIQKTGVTFTISEFHISGGQALTITGISNNYNPLSCSESSQATRLNNAAQLVKTIETWAASDFSRLSPTTMVLLEDGQHVFATTLLDRVQQQFTSYLEASRYIPEISLNCTGKSQCTTRSSAEQKTLMLLQLSNIRHEALLANRVLRENGKRSIESSSRRIAQIMEKGVSARKAIRKLLATTGVCILG